MVVSHQEMIGCLGSGGSGASKTNLNEAQDIPEEIEEL